MNHLDQTPEERVQGMRNRAALAAFVIVAILAAAFIAFAPNSHASSANVSRETTQVPKCAEDQVLTRRARCIDRDDSTTRFKRVSEAGWGYWYDTRHPRSLRMRPLVPGCHRWQMVTRYGNCVATAMADFRGGYWYRVTA